MQRPPEMQTVRLLGHLRILCPTCFLVRSLSNKKVDLYSVLGVKFNAEQKEIKDSFYKLSKQFHPDLNEDNDEASAKFKDVAEAYETLSNPEKRQEYDRTMGFGRRSENPEQNGEHSSGRGNKRKFRGMKGVFRDGKFVDDEETPQMRNIEYDLSPEKMEKIWARYKSRWDRVDEVEKMEKLKKKKEEFRRRVDLKREKMNQMTEDEKEDFLFKLRLLRTDAADEPLPENEKSENVEKKNESERVRLKDKESLEKKRKEREKQAEMERITREVMMNQFGMSEKTFDEKMGRSKRRDPANQGWGGTDFSDRSDDVLYEGLDSSKDAANWRSMLSRGLQANNEKWARMKEAREDTVYNNSYKHGINGEPERKYGIVVASVLGLGIVILLTIEYRHRDQLDN